MDDDTDNNGINLPNDLIDDFLITIPNNVSYIGKETVSTYFIGRFNISLIELSFEVICAPDFIGERCEVVADDCVGPLSNCSGNGQCIDGIHSFTCKCELGFTGTHCETNIDDCASINCTGNGVCKDSINNFTCICAPGFAGSLCEIDIDDCLNVTCSNKGMCRDKVNNFTCECDAGFGGTLCDININECAQLNVNCSGHGTCVDGVYSYHCDCEPGYTGQLCEIDIDDCVGVNCTGNRHCLDGVNRYDCVCSSEYFGTSCNIRKQIILLLCFVRSKKQSVTLNFFCIIKTLDLGYLKCFIFYMVDTTGIILLSPGPYYACILYMHNINLD